MNLNDHLMKLDPAIAQIVRTYVEANKHNPVGFLSRNRSEQSCENIVEEAINWNFSRSN